MKKFLLIFGIFIFMQPSYAWSLTDVFNRNPDTEVKNAILTQVKYANRNNFNKFISTYEDTYVSCDGFGIDVYSQLVKDIWNTYKNVKYNVKFKNISVDGENAVVELTEYTDANLKLTPEVTGKLKSESESIYYMHKVNGKWKVSSDIVLDENTSMLYGDAQDIDIKLTVPLQVEEDTEYTASLEFIPPEQTVAIASISSEKVEYPQKQAKEVYRTMPEDNILERLFTSNKDKLNEYVIASIGLTKTDICDLSIKLSLTGFGYVIRRVNVIPAKIEACD